MRTWEDNISDEYLLESYMGGLKEDLKHELFLKQPENIMEAMKFSHNIQAKNKAKHNSSMGAYIGSKYYFEFRKKTLPQLTRISPNEMEKTRAKG